MKYTLLTIFAFLFVVFLSSCDSDEKDSNTDSVEITNENEIVPITKENVLPENSDAGLSQLDMLANSKLGWINIDEYEGEQSIMLFSEDAKHNYSLDWNTNKYMVTSDGDWITIYDPEEINSGEFVQGECYAINFLAKDTFKICYVHMCARIKDEYWDTYARIKENEDIISLNRSNDPEDINKILDKINGKYFEVEYKDGIFRKLCTHYNIHKRNAEENEEHDNFWFDHVMDGYEYHIENVSYDPMIPEKYIFEGTENYFEEKKSKLSFMTFNKYRVLTVESNNEKLWYMHEDDYDNIAEPAEPCDEEEQ